MRKEFKQRQRTKRAVEEIVELSVPARSLSDTSDAAELLARLDEVLSESR